MHAIALPRLLVTVDATIDLDRSAANDAAACTTEIRQSVPLAAAPSHGAQDTTHDDTHDDYWLGGYAGI